MEDEDLVSAGFSKVVLFALMLSSLIIQYQFCKKLSIKMILFSEF
jgi:hypothetical protein